MVIGNNAFGDLRGDLRGSGLFFIHCDTRNMGGEMSDDFVKRLRTVDIYDYADADKICREAAARIEILEGLVQTAFGLLWYDKHNQARRHLADALTIDDRGKGIQLARDYDDKYKPGEIPLPQPVGKAIEALEEAAKQSQWWSVDEDNDTSWITFRAAAVMLTHWAAGLGGEDAGKE